MTNYAYRATILALFLALPLVACGPGAGSADSEGSAQSQTGQETQAADTTCAALASLPTEEGDLTDRLEQARILSAGSSKFREPRGTDLLAFERAFGRLLGGADPTAVQELQQLGFSVSRYREASSRASWLLVQEAENSGGGTFAINLSPARDLWLEAPHADSDKGTLEQSAAQVVALGARALLITGANRCASATTTACESGVTAACDGRLRTSDAAHFADNYFTAAHRALRAAFPTAVAVSIHGMESSGKEAAVVSNGTRLPNPGSLSLRLRDAVNRYLGASGGQAFSCNDPAENGKFRPLCGATNVQGRIDNGSGDACYAGATSAQDRFLHVEQGPELRSGRGMDPVGQALAETIPCSLPGAGLDCPAPPAPSCT
ncbi:MAG TPA: hypothetical protein VFO83_15560 [Aggregicoccus sp.]|nr:hypothetical protein [Aggregicoccus sp.]